MSYVGPKALIVPVTSRTNITLKERQVPPNVQVSSAATTDDVVKAIVKSTAQAHLDETKKLQKAFHETLPWQNNITIGVLLYRGRLMNSLCH